MAKAPIKKGQIQRGFKPKLETVLDDTNTKDSLLDKVEGDLIKEGIVPFDSTNVMQEYLRLPADITDVESRELGRYFNTFTQQKMYCRTLLGRTSALLRELMEELDEIKDRVFSELPAKMSVTEKNLKLRSHPKYGQRACELLEEVAYLEEKRNMLSDYLENLIDGITCISREITRRVGDFENERREENISKKRF